MPKCKVTHLDRTQLYKFSDLKKAILSKARRERSDPVSAETNNSYDYLEFFGRYVKNLRRSNHNQAIGTCPFHEDQHPSWSMRLADGIWHCFGCNMSGTAVSFCVQRNISLSECPGGGESQDHTAVAIEQRGYVMWKREKFGWRKLRITDFLIEWNYENRISDRIRLEDRIFEGHVVLKNGKRIPICITNDDFCSNHAFYAALIRECGSQIRVNERYIDRVRFASLLFSKARLLQTTMDFGFQADDTFLTPTLKITAEGIEKATRPQIDLSAIEHARHLDFTILSNQSRKDLLKHLGSDLLELQPHKITYSLLGLVGTAPLMHFMDDKTRFAFWIVGPSGSGKSFIAKMFQSFFGNFTIEGRVPSWSSTINSLQYLGYFFKDCIFLIDDYKPVMARNEGWVVQFLQTYADVYSRSRLTSEIKSRKDYFVRGLLLTTGEDVPAGHASVVARSLIISMEKKKPDLIRGQSCRKNCKAYSAITSRYILYLLRRRNLRSELSEDLNEAHEFFLKGIDREENAVRIARNLALSWLGFKWITRFLKAAKAPLDLKSMRKEHKRNLLELRGHMLGLVSQEQPAPVFIEALRECIDSGACTLSRKTKYQNKIQRDKSTVGFWEEENDSYIYIFPPEAMAAVRFQLQRLGRRFDWTPNAISKALATAGYLVKKTLSQDSAVRKRSGKKIYRVWKLRKDSLGWNRDEEGL
jgi:CHC2 zinc finger